MRRSVLSLLVIVAVLLASPLAMGAEEKSAEFYVKRSVEHTKKGKFDQAIADLSKALMLNPRNALAYNNRGILYRKKGQLDRALSDYNRALKLNPRFAEAYNNRAVAYYYKKEYDKAWDDVRKAQSLGHKVQPGLIKALRQASVRRK